MKSPDVQTANGGLEMVQEIHKSQVFINLHPNLHSELSFLPYQSFEDQNQELPLIYIYTYFPMVGEAQFKGTRVPAYQSA
jgi:hypothetical protein